MTPHQLSIPFANDNNQSSQPSRFAGGTESHQLDAILAAHPTKADGTSTSKQEFGKSFEA